MSEQKFEVYFDSLSESSKMEFIKNTGISIYKYRKKQEIYIPYAEIGIEC